MAGGHELSNADALQVHPGMAAIIFARVHEARPEGRNRRLQERSVIESDRVGGHGKFICGMDIGAGSAYSPILSETAGQ